MEIRGTQKKNVHLFNKTHGQVAILIDGDFFIKRVLHLDNLCHVHDTEFIKQSIKTLCSKHAYKLGKQIYRIFFYDCPPYADGIHNPLTGKFVNFKNTPSYKFKSELHAELKKMRKMALRLGEISFSRKFGWGIKSEKLKNLLSGKITVADLDPEKDIFPNFHQKQVDMKIGVDIASMVFKHQVDSIVLVAGDGDFVPASKMARREGIDFILDPMFMNINPALNEHVDGLHSVIFSRKQPRTPLSPALEVTTLEDLD